MGAFLPVEDSQLDEKFGVDRDGSRGSFALARLIAYFRRIAGQMRKRNARESSIDWQRYTSPIMILYGNTSGSIETRLGWQSGLHLAQPFTPLNTGKSALLFLCQRGSHLAVVFFSFRQGQVVRTTTLRENVRDFCKSVTRL